ncbi:hypothetical protein Vadar_017414 [Vaccinium darrowii]|uniref:Uncharacterized protein n=1 Tax=Vaccinium darrowii TaxID=229202 RepID=A0ACB7Y0C9_9ERIC|nr:hypothetical protein Vadar_017414 [Vaccinium darrowii]
MIEGDIEKQYAKLPDYCEELRRTNPDTTVILKTVEDDETEGRQKFERLAAEVVQYAEHRFCIRHFYNNFKETNKGLHLKEILFSAAKATYVAQFNFHMQELQETDEEAMTWLNDHPPMHWSRSHFCTFSNCEILDNMCESLNDTILKETYMASYEPIIYPLNGMYMWTPTRVIGPLPPNVKKQAGRPKKLKKRGNDEPRDSTTLKRRNTTTTCSQCGKLGHNKRSCKGQPIPRKQTARRSNLALGRNVGLESSSQATMDCTRGKQATMGSARGRQKSSSQSTMSTPTRRSQRQAQQSSTQPPMGSTRGRKKGLGAGSR